MNYNPNDVPLPIADVGFSGAIQTRVRWDDNISWFNIPDKVVLILRFFGPISIYYHHWFKTKTGKKFPSICAGYDHATQAFVKGRCPFEDDFNIPQIVEEAKKINPLFDEENDPFIKELKAAKCGITGYGHVIVRNSVNFQSNDRSGGRPWQPIKIPKSVVWKLFQLRTMNMITISGKTYEADVADPYWGRDIQIMYNSAERNPQAKYTINMGEHTPLTEVERSYLTQLYQWQNIVEYPSYDEMKQQLHVNGYYQMLNQLKGVSSFDQRPQQFAHMEQYMPQVPKSPYGDAPLPYVPQQVPNMPQASMPYPQMPSQQMQQQMPQMPQMQQQMPQMQQMQQQQMPQQNRPMQVPQQVPQQVLIPQNTMPQAPMPNMGYGQQTPNSYPGAGMVEADLPMASPIPQNVPPPMGMQMEDDEIPFDNGGVAEQHSMPTPPVSTSQKTYVVRGKPNGVSAAEFQQIVFEFGNNLPRAKPFKNTNEDSELEGLKVLACYGNYCGDLSCVKCPLRQFCLHV